MTSGPERVKGRFVAQLVFFFHLQLDLVERNVAWPLDHHLDVVFPGFFRQLAKDFQLGELRLVAGVGEAAGAKTIAQRETDVVLLENLANSVEILVQKILLLVEAHPLRQHRATAADDSRNAIAHQRQEFAQHPGMDGHVIHALLGLLFDHFEHHVDIQIFRATNARDSFVNRHGADGDRRRVDDRFADCGNVAAGGKVHHGIRAVVDGTMEFFKLVADFRSGCGISNVGIDFAAACNADSHRLEIAVMDIGGNDGAAARDFAADQFRFELLALGNVFHLLGNDALAGEVHLREVFPVAVRRGCRRCCALVDPFIPQCHKTP